MGYTIWMAQHLTLLPVTYSDIARMQISRLSAVWDMRIQQQSNISAHQKILCPFSGLGLPEGLHIRAPRNT
jgi:hypothetical protein